MVVHSGVLWASFDNLWPRNKHAVPFAFLASVQEGACVMAAFYAGPVETILQIQDTLLNKRKSQNQQSTWAIQRVESCVPCSGTEHPNHNTNQQMFGFWY